MLDSNGRYQLASRHEPPDAHLAGLSGGGGCTELWEYLSDYRNAERSARW